MLKNGRRETIKRNAAIFCGFNKAPQELCDPHCTVVQAEPGRELDLYTGRVEGIQ